MIAGLLFVFATFWAAAILVAPRVVATGADHPVVSVAGAVVYLVGGLVCHQRPERSFKAAGVQYPVCARCTGLYVSAPFGVLAGLLFGRARWLRGDGGTDALYRQWRLIVLAAAVPTLVSILLERLGGPSDTISRALAALPLGATAAAVVATAILGHFAQRVPAGGSSAGSGTRTGAGLGVGGPTSGV